MALADISAASAASAASAVAATAAAATVDQWCRFDISFDTFRNLSAALIERKMNATPSNSTR
jgi:hypothetical protein